MSALLLPVDSPVRGGAVTVDANGVPRVAGMLTRAEFEQIERIRNSQYYLVRNDGGEMGERSKCKTVMPDGSIRGCGGDHAYFTLMCAERPWRGIEDGLRYWLKAATPGPRRSTLLAGMDRGLVDYAQAHRFSASHLAPTDPGMVNWYAMLAGTHIPIKLEKARELARKIKDRRPFVFPLELQSLLLPANMHI